MGKHAYMIMAHKNDYTFRTLLHLLDDERNTLFVHMDKKVEDYSIIEIEKLIHKAIIVHTPKRLDVKWGGYSQIELELLLLNTATSKDIYEFYHLISGEDLPIKPQNIIHQFYNENIGKEFIHYSPVDIEFKTRYQIYHLFQDVPIKYSKIFRLINIAVLNIQEFLHIERYENQTFRMGSNWFDITDGFARYILSKEDWIRKTYKYTANCDEVFVQTLMICSEFEKNLYRPATVSSMEANQRCIDWSRSNGLNPWTFRIEDKDMLTQSHMLFARKFNCEIDREIIDYVSNNLAVLE